MRAKFTLCFFGKLIFALVFCGIISGHKLSIFPASSVQVKPIGNSVFIICKADVRSPELISDLVWRDNKGQIVQVDDKHNSTMYTEIIPGDSLVLLVINSITMEMTGNFTCTASYATNETLSAEVFLQAVIPEQQSTAINTNYKIKCKPKESSTPVIIWLRNVKAIMPRNKYLIDDKDLAMRNVEEPNDDVDVCHAQIHLTKEISDKQTQVDVAFPPVIETMEPIEIVEGESISVQCKAKGKPPPTYIWIKETKDLSTPNRFSVDHNTGSLTINKAQNYDHSEYTCIASNSAATAKSTIKISVLVKPRIYEFANITSPIGCTTTLVCKAIGWPLPMITFRKFGASNYFVAGKQPQDTRITLEQQTDEHKQETLGRLSVSDLRRDDDGLYECFAKNKIGEYKRNGHITVEFKPTFINNGTNLTVWWWNNKLANLSCLPEAIPNATIKWRVNGYEIRNDNNIQVIGSGPHSFLIVNVSNSNAFNKTYKCIATNTLGFDEQLFTLRQAFPPLPIRQVNVLTTTAATVRFAIVKPPVSTGFPIKSITVQYKIEGLTWDTAKNKTWAVDSQYILENLQAEKTYAFRFAASNDAGMGPWTLNQNLTIPRSSPPNKPSILVAPKDDIVLSPYHDFFKLNWKIPYDNGNPIDYYEVTYCPEQRVNGKFTVSWDDCKLKVLSGSDNSKYNIIALSSDTHYRIEVRAHNAVGFSIPSVVTIKTA